MNIFQFTRELMEIESISWNEGAAGRWLRDYLVDAGFEAEAQTVTGDRINVYARIGSPKVTFSSHIDTVPPFIGFSEDEKNIYGRGACDAKGIAAAQIIAAERLRGAGESRIGLLFVVDEETGGGGAKTMNGHRAAQECRYLVNGEPTENRLIRGCNLSPGAWTTFNGAKLKICDATPLPARDPKGIGGKVSEVVVVDAESFTVVCADGRFKVTRVQADGPKVGAGEWAAAAKLEKGARFS